MNASASVPLPLLQQVFAERLAFTATGDRVPLHSNISHDEAAQLYALVRELKPSVSVEIGFAQGISTLAILRALADNGAGCHHVLDPFQDRFNNVGRSMVERAGLAERMVFHQQFAEEIIPKLPRLQFAFIDSSHLFDLTVTEFVLVDKKLEVGGLVAFHDLWMPSLQKLARYVLANRSYRLAPSTGSMPERYSLRRKLKTIASRALNALPGSAKIFREELLRPWFTITDGNLLVLQKTGEDGRDWEFHQPF